MKKIQVLIADDEPLERKKIMHLLKDDSELEIVCQTKNGIDTIREIQSKNPDLVFLDIQMPDLDGFGVIHALDPQSMPRIIFVTAYNEYALKAFEVHAIDYLLKPFDKKRLEKAVDFAKKSLFIDQEVMRQRMQEMMSSMRKDQKNTESIIIKCEGHIYFIKTDKIDWIESSGNYVTIHSENQEHMCRDTLKNLEKKLDNKQFVRVHRTKIVNVTHIKEIKPWFHGDSIIVLQNKKEIPLSRNYKENLLHLFNE